VRAPERQVQEAERIKQRLRRVPEGVHDHPLGDLRGARAIGVSAHAVDDHQQRRALGDRGCHPVLILLAPAEQAHVSEFEPQENPVHLLDLAVIYITCAVRGRSGAT
jgi:hypothetical protein